MLNRINWLRSAERMRSMAERKGTVMTA
jgi:hypothetical protein